MKKVDEIKNLIHIITDLLAKEGKTMSDENFNLNAGQLIAYAQILDIKKPKAYEQQYTTGGIADNINYWTRQRKANKVKAIELNYFSKSVEELKAELKKAEEDEQAAYKAGGQNQKQIVNAIERQYAVKYAINNIE